MKLSPQEGDEPEPADLFVSGPDWLLWTREPENRFPHYRDVIPASGSKFIVDRHQVLETLGEVSLATNADGQAVRLDLCAESVRVLARAPGVGESSGTVPAEFGGGGDDRIITAFEPTFLLDAPSRC